MTRTNLAAALASLLAVGACDRIPGTPANQIRQMEKAASATFFDPEAVNYRSPSLHKVWLAVAPKPVTALCVEANGKNRQGAYVGFKRVIYAGAQGGLIADPVTEITKSEVDEASKACKAAMAIPDASLADLTEASDACQKAADLHRDWGPQMAFEAVWKDVCVLPTPATRPQSQIDAAREAGITIPAS